MFSVTDEMMRGYSGNSFRVIPTLTHLSDIVSDISLGNIYSDILSGIYSDIAFDILSGTYPDILSDIIPEPGIYSDILSGMSTQPCSTASGAGRRRSQRGGGDEDKKEEQE